MKKILSYILCFSLLVSSFSVVSRGKVTMVSAASSKVWDGTADTSWFQGDLDYYEISTAEQLAGFAQLVNEGNSFKDVTICLTNDIVLNKTNKFKEWNKKKPKNEWTMIGSKSKPFRGIFNGQGHSIIGLYIKDTKQYSNWFNTWYSDAGLFGYVKGATIVNLKMKNAYLNTPGNVGTVSAYSENSNFYGIEISNVRLENGNAGGIVGQAAYDYTETYYNIFSVIAIEAMFMMAGFVVNPLIFGDAIWLPNDFAGNIFFSCKVKNLNCQGTKTTGGIVALGGSSDSGVGIANSLVMNYKVKSNGQKGIFMGVKPSNNYALMKNCYTMNSSITKGCKNKQFIDKKKVKNLKKKTLYSSGAKKLGKAFKYVKGKEPQLKLFVSTKSAPADETKYRVLQDGYYTISYGSSYMTVNDKADVEISSAPQKFYFQYRPGGYYTVTSEQGYILTANSSNDDVYVQNVEYNEHRFTQRWVLEPRNDFFYMKLRGTEKAISNYSGFMFFSGTGVTLDKDWLEDESIGYNVIWKITPAQ